MSVRERALQFALRQSPTQPDRCFSWPFNLGGFLPELRGAREWQYQVRGSVDRIHSVVHGPGLNEADLLLEEKKSSSPVFYLLTLE